jgi:hypothetical protein
MNAVYAAAVSSAGHVSAEEVSMGFIDWLCQHTVDPEAHEVVMAAAYRVEAASQSECNELYENSDDLDMQQGQEFLIDCMKTRNRLRTELEERGYEYSFDEEDGHVFSRGDEEPEEEQSGAGGFFGWLLGR